MSNEFLFQQELRALRPCIMSRLSRHGLDLCSAEMRADEIMVAVNLRFMRRDDGRSAQDLIDDIF